MYSSPVQLSNSPPAPLIGQNLKAFDREHQQKPTRPPSPPTQVLEPPQSAYTGATGIFKSNHVYENLPDNFNLGFQDSASQIKNEQNMNVQDLKNRPFASNLENARILAQLTQHRIDKLDINPAQIQELVANNSEETHEYQQQYQ